MTIETNLFVRRSTYYLRIARSVELQELRQRAGLPRGQDVWRSLRTSQLHEARRRIGRERDAAYRGFDEEKADLRKRLECPPRTPTELEINQAVFVFKRRELDIDRMERLHLPTPTQLAAAKDAAHRALEELEGASPLKQLLDDRVMRFWGLATAKETDQERRSLLRAELERHRREGEFVLVDWAVQELAHVNHWLIEPDSIAYKLIADALMAAWINTLKAIEVRDRNGVDTEDAEFVVLNPWKPLAVDPPANSESDATRTRTSIPSKATKGSQTPARGERLADYFDVYLRERKADVVGATAKDKRAVLRRFVELVGERAPGDYTRDDVSAFKRELQQFPVNASKLYPGLDLREIVTRNKVDGHPRLSVASINNKLSTLSAFGKWLEENVAGVDARSLATSKLTSRKAARKRRPFTDAEVVALLNSKAFVGCESSQSHLKPGKFRVRDYRFWVTLIAAFTGMRLNEITQLRATDIRQVDGVWMVDIDRNGDGKSTKTRSSKRLVPIHSALVDLGLVSLAAALTARGGGALFPEIPVDSDGRRSKQAGQWFGRFLTRLGIKGAEAGRMHRFRHTVADKLREAGTGEQDIAKVLGHSVDLANMTNKYGMHQAVAAKERQAIIESIRYEGLDLSLLR